VPDIVRSEQIKLFAGMLDRVGTVCLAVGVVTPISSSILGGPPLPVNFSGVLTGVMIWAALFIALHWAAQYVLEGLQE